MSNKPKILVLTSTFPRWDNDTDPPFVYELSRRLTKDFSITILAPHYPGASRHENLEGMEVYRFRYFWKKYEKLAGQTGILPTLRKHKLYLLVIPFFLSAQLLSLLHLCFRLRPDIIHAHWLIPQGFMAALASICTGIPFIATAHGADVFGLNSWLPERLKAFTLAKAGHITVVSHALYQNLATTQLHDKLSIIPMGVDSKRFSPALRSPATNRKNHPELLFVGRLSEKKGVAYLLQAMPQILKAFPRTRLRLVGGGELGEILKKQAEELQLGNNIEFCGAIPNAELPNYYAAADIFIGPSIQATGGDTEGFGLTFVEASLSGCLVIGTRVGGIGDVIKDGETGFLVPEKDSSAIAKKVIYALRHQEEMRAICENAIEQCKDNFDWQVISRKYSDLLNETIAAIHAEQKP